LQRLQQQEALLRPVAQPRLPAVVTNLSSIWELLSEVQDDVHGELQQLFKSHTWVGMVSSPCFVLLLSSLPLVHLPLQGSARSVNIIGVNIIGVNIILAPGADVVRCKR
jgi:hypothetical protein